MHAHVVLCLNVDIMKDMLYVVFAEKGSNIGRLQEQTFIHFTDFLDECYGKLA